MKKQLTLLSIIVGICLLFSACNNANGIGTTQSTFERHNENSTEVNNAAADENTNVTEETSAGVHTTDEIVHPDIDVHTANFYTIEEYNNFISTADTLSDSFVYYDSIKSFGEFESLIFLSFTNDGDYSWYLYSFTDSSGQEIGLYVDEKSRAVFYTPTFELDPTTTDLRKIDSANLREVTQVGDMIYVYIYGKLSSISWESNGIQFALTGNSLLGDYQETEESTFISRFLDYRTAVGANATIFTATN